MNTKIGNYSIGTATTQKLPMIVVKAQNLVAIVPSLSPPQNSQNLFQKTNQMQTRYGGKG